MILPTFLFLTFYSSSVFSNAETELARVKVRSEEERHAMERKVHLMVEVSAHLSLANTIYTYISLVNLFTRRQRGDSMRPRAWGTRCRYSSTVHMYSDSTVNRLLQAARDAEKDAKVKLMDFLNNSVADVSKSSPTWNGTTTLSPNGE